MKKKILILISSLLSALVLFFTISFNTNVYAYHYDPINDNVISDNLLNFNDVAETTYLGITYKVQNGVIYLNGLSQNEISLYFTINEQVLNGTYYYYIEATGTTSNSLSKAFREGTTNVVNLTDNNTFSVSNRNINKLLVYIPNATIITNYVYKPMLVSGSTAPSIFEPYGVYVNQDLYIDLQNDFDDLNNDYTTLQSDYNTLQSDYNTLQLSFNGLQTQYNLLQNQFNDLSGIYSALQDEYNALQQQYTTLMAQYDSLVTFGSSLHFALNGATARLYRSDNDELIMSEVINIQEDSLNFDNTCIPDINDYLSSYDDTDNINYPTPYVYLVIDMNTFIDKSLLFTFNNTILSTQITLNNIDTGQFVTVNSTDEDNLNHYQLVINNEFISFNRIKYDGFYMPDYTYINFSISLDGLAYQLGFNRGVDSLSDLITNQNNDIINLNQRIIQLTNTISSLNGVIATKDEQLSNNFGWSSFFGGMVDIPFQTIFNFMNVDILGFNLFHVLAGIITALAMLWLIKRLYK